MADLVVDPRSVPFRKPFADVDPVIRTKVFARGEATTLCPKYVASPTSGLEGPTGTRTGFCHAIRIADPRQWSVAGSSNARPKEWDIWHRQYRYFTVTGAKVHWRVTYRPDTGDPSRDAPGLPLFSGTTLMMDVNTYSTKGYMQSQLSGPDDLWKMGWFRGKPFKPILRDYRPQTVIGAGWIGAPTTVNQNNQVAQMASHQPMTKSITKYWDLTKWYETEVTGGTATSHTIANLPWMYTDHDAISLAQTTLNDPIMWCCGEDKVNASERYYMYQEWYITWDVMFAGPRFELDNIGDLTDPDPDNNPITVP